MKYLVAAPAAFALLSSTALASGLDRTGQPITLIFEEGTYAELSFAATNAMLEGTDSLFAPGTSTGDVGQGFNMWGGGFKTDLNDRLSLGVIFDQPWGVDVLYPTTGGASLAGTKARADSNAITGIARYKFNDNFSAHAGIRYQTVEGDITLSGARYGALSGYQVDVERDGGFGWVAGVAYEKPEIALRVALTYQSEVDHTFDLSESISPVGTSTETNLPQSVNLDFQSGVAKNTLVFGSVRWVEHSSTDLVVPAASAAVSAVTGVPTEVDLIDLDDSITYTIGVGRKLNDNWSVSAAYIYEDGQNDDVVSPLAPTHGMQAIRLGVQYSQDKFKISAGVRYTELGDAQAAPGGVAPAGATFEDSKAVSFGIKVGYYF